jgi:glycine/D-amino acid oxidase-like deaminating enzyme
MPALLSASYRETVLWQEQATLPAIPDGSLPASADCVVVGAGYAGLSCGRELAGAGRQVVVLDTHPIGWGASSRNGGMAIPELKAGPRALERSHGPLGRRMYAEVNEAFDELEALIARHGIDCNYERSGQLYLAHAQRLVPELRAMASEHGELGEDVRFVEGDELAGEIGSAAYPGAVVIARTGGLHPARLHAGLARLALDAGASLQGGVRAVSIERRGRADGGSTAGGSTAGGRTGGGGSGAGYRVTTSSGTIDAADVVVCTNAYADSLLPELQRRVLPIGSFIIATEVLDPALARDVSPQGRMLVDTKSFLYYWRLTPDGRVLFGGRRSLMPSTIAQARDFLYDSMLRVHPQLTGVRVERAWGGDVAVTRDRLPHVGRLHGAAKGVWYATGCNGSGVALNTWLGARIGRHLLDRAAPPSFAELGHPTIPLHQQRRWYLPLVGLWYRWHDRGFAPAR